MLYCQNQTIWSNQTTTYILFWYLHQIVIFLRPNWSINTIPAQSIIFYGVMIHEGRKNPVPFHPPTTLPNLMKYKRSPRQTWRHRNTSYQQRSYVGLSWCHKRTNWDSKLNDWMNGFSTTLFTIFRILLWLVSNNTMHIYELFFLLEKIACTFHH